MTDQIRAPRPDDSSQSGRFLESNASNRLPLSPNEIRNEILLTMVDGVGPRLYQRLLARFQCAAEVLNANRSDLLDVNGLGPKLIEKILNAKNLPVDSLIDLCEKENIDIIYQNDIRYPASLRTIKDPPVLLYQRGSLVSSDAFSISVVGTRGVTPYGRKVTLQLVSELTAAGFTIVSGLACGVDGIAHRAALQTQGRTIGVLGSGILNVFPAEHIELARQITGSGAVLSEFHPFCPPRAGNFPQRNRIVSGLSLGTLVIESPVKGGALITAQLAREQNREVFAVPGPIDQVTSKGCHRLLKEGARLTDSVNDIIDTLGSLARQTRTTSVQPSVQATAELGLNETERKLFDLMTSAPIPIDEIIEQSGLSPRQALAAIAALEFQRVVKRLEGNKIQRI